MNFFSLLLCVLVKMSVFEFVQNDFVWAAGKCRQPETEWNWKERGIVGIRTARMQTNSYSGKCVYINVTKSPYKNQYFFEKVTRIYNTSHAEWKVKEKGIWKVQNGTWYFFGKLELPFRSMTYHVLSQSSNCLCVYACEQFLLLHRWEFTSYHYNNRWCGFWWYTRCSQNFWSIGINIRRRMTRTEIWWCPRITEDDDHPAAEPGDCKAATKCGNTIIKAGESVANLVHGVYKKILQKLFGNETKVVTGPTTTTTTSTTEKDEGTTTIPPYYRPGEPPRRPGYIEMEYY